MKLLTGIKGKSLPHSGSQHGHKVTTTFSVRSHSHVQFTDGHSEENLCGTRYNTSSICPGRGARLRLQSRAPHRKQREYCITGLSTKTLSRTECKATSIDQSNRKKQRAQLSYGTVVWRNFPCSVYGSMQL